MKKVCVVTGSRAEYGLLNWVMEGLQNSDTCELLTIATGMHLSTEFGLTYKSIVDDGFGIDWKVEMLLGSDTAVGITKSMGLAMIGFADGYDALKPDLVVVLGDRFEILAAVSAALIAGIPVAHLHGGEVTKGAYDDEIRHAITKMSTLHFTAAEPYRDRVIRMGEDPQTVWNVGGFGIDGILRTDFMDRDTLERGLDFKLGKRNLLVTFHPETAGTENPKCQMQALLDALETTDAHLIFTMPNADNDGREFFKMIQNFVSRHPQRSCAHVSLGLHRYLSTMKHVDGVIGNSSSGLIEAPAMKKGTINIGARQDGRLRADSVIDSPANSEDIKSAIEQLFSEPFQEKLNDVVNPYGNGGASEQTVSLIQDWLSTVHTR